MCLYLGVCCLPFTTLTSYCYLTYSKMCHNGDVAVLFVEHTAKQSSSEHNFEQVANNVAEPSR